MKFSKVIAQNVLARSPLTGEFYFCPKVAVYPNGDFQVIGKKFDVSKYLRPYLKKKYLGIIYFIPLTRLRELSTIVICSAQETRQ